MPFQFNNLEKESIGKIDVSNDKAHTEQISEGSRKSSNMPHTSNLKVSVPQYILLQRLKNTSISKEAVEAFYDLDQSELDQIERFMSCTL